MEHAFDHDERTEVSEERFRSLFDNHPDAMLTFDSGSVVALANAAAARLVGRSTSDLVGSTLLDLIDPPSVVEALAAFNRALAGFAGGIEVRIAARAASVPAFVTLIPIRVRERAIGVHMHVRDRRAELAQHAENALHAERIRDLYLTAVAANENAERQIAATLEAGCRILGMSGAALFDAETGAIAATFGTEVPTALARLATTSAVPLAIIDHETLVAEQADAATPIVALLATRIVTASDGLYGSLSFATTVPRGRPFGAVDLDLVQLMGALVGSAIELGRSRARLPNRPWLIEHLHQRLEEARADGTTIGVLVLDLDRCKDIDDTLGHESGDRLLQIVAERLRRAIRGSDCVARMGGDAFVVLALDQPRMHDLAVLAERIIAAVEAPVDLGGSEHVVTTSIGIASFPHDGVDAETLVKHAELAMYRAKDRGRNTYACFTPALDASLRT